MSSRLDDLLDAGECGLHVGAMLGEATMEDFRLLLRHRIDREVDPAARRPHLHPLRESRPSAVRLEGETPRGRRLIDVADRPPEPAAGLEVADRRRGLPLANRRVTVAADKACTRGRSGDDVEPLRAEKFGAEPSWQLDVRHK